MRIFLGLGLFVACAWGQAPVITHVVTTGPLDTNFAPGSAVYIFGTFVPHSAGRDYTINVGAASGGINVAADAVYIIATIPANAPTGQQSLTISYQDHVSNALGIAIAPAAPEFDGQGVTIANENAFQPNPYYPFTHVQTSKPVTPTNPAVPGEPVSCSLYGLGASPATPTLTVGGASVSPASYQFSNNRANIIFFVPSQAQIGIASVVATFGGVNSNSASLPVGSAPAIGSILSGASFGSAGTVAPGSIVSIFGENFGTQDSVGTFPSTTVNGVTVMFGSTPAPIFALAAAEGQINVLVPDELPTSGTINVTVQTAGGTSAPFPVNLAAATPGIFYFADPLDPARHNAAAIQANTAWIAMPLSMAAEMGLPSNCTALGAGTLCGEPIHPGAFLQAYVTGLGQATPGGDPGGAVLPTGSVAPANGNPLYETAATPTVTIGGQPAQVFFAGIAPGYAGLYQVDVQVPAGAPTGDDIPLQISMPGSAADTATISIQ